MKKLTVLAAALALSASYGAANAQVSGDTVKIGVLNDQSGPYSDLAGKGSFIAAQMAAEDFGGKVLGKPIEIITADHQNKPDIASNIANQWIDTENVDAIVDVPTSSVALAIQEITKNKNRVHINSGAASSDLTGKNCSPTGVHWTYDTYALAKGTGGTLVKEGGDSWFFITADYAFGHALERDTTAAVTAAGGKVVGAVRHPFPGTTDFSSFLLQAQSSGAKVVGIANAGTDTINTIKQAGEFGLVAGGQKLAGLLVFLSDVHSLGLKTAQGLVVTDGWYWDRDDETRAFAKKFAARNGGKMPTMVQAGVYSGISHYLKAIDAAKTDEAKAAVAKMKELPINDFFAKNGKVREDGRMVHDMLLVQVKKPEESKGPWDYYKILSVIPGDEAYRPMKAEFGCSLVK
ncbi:MULTISPECIES: ABC transporter substrate-binding protein [Rhodomicrobium]|uniref:ABC transporter substrate-binding protein n=1 Tax=Rhodomicrobium TaxID=1068 RepID=UPI000B4BA9EF|nr:MULTISPECIES: ABC transporter substrate-binding protein [Rhodomicrobium]